MYSEINTRGLHNLHILCFGKNSRITKNERHEMKKTLQNKASVMITILLAVISCCILMLPHSASAADDALCACVKIEISQELTLERHDVYEDLSATFYIRVAWMENIDDLDGAGTVRQVTI